MNVKLIVTVKRVLIRDGAVALWNGTVGWEQCQAELPQAHGDCAEI